MFMNKLPIGVLVDCMCRGGSLWMMWVQTNLNRLYWSNMRKGIAFTDTTFNKNVVNNNNLLIPPVPPRIQVGSKHHYQDFWFFFIYWPCTMCISSLFNTEAIVMNECLREAVVPQHLIWLKWLVWTFFDVYLSSWNSNKVLVEVYCALKYGTEVKFTPVQRTRRDYQPLWRHFEGVMVFWPASVQQMLLCF